MCEKVVEVAIRRTFWEPFWEPFLIKIKKMTKNDARKQFPKQHDFFIVFGSQKEKLAEAKSLKFHWFLYVFVK